MHKPLTKFALAGAATALTMIPALAAAQDPADEATAADNAAMAAQQPASEDAKLASLPADKQAAIKAWPPETRQYYWSLTQERQKLFWALSDPDKVTLSQMPEQQRESTWAQIESRAAPPKA